MGEFRKKPVVIEAELISDLMKSFASNWDGLPNWVKNNYEDGVLIPFADHLSVRTAEGIMRGELTDMLIKGVNGELYPCKIDIFEKTYDKV